MNLANLNRQLGNVIRMGAITEQDGDRVRVKTGDNVTPWIPWLVARAGEDFSWWAPSIGEQVVLAAPQGDLAQAVVLGSVYQAEKPNDDLNPDVVEIRLQDGATFAYDKSTSTLSVNLPGEATINVEGDLALSVSGDVKVSAKGNAQIISGGSATVQAGSSATLEAKGVVNIKGVAVRLNG